MGGGHHVARGHELGLDAQFARFYHDGETGVSVLRALAGGADQDAVVGDDLCVGAERTAIDRYLRQQQDDRHHGCKRIGTGVGRMTQLHHALAVRDLDDVEGIAFGAAEWLGRHHFSLAKRGAEMCAKSLPIGADNGDLFDGRGVKRGLPHRFYVARRAGIDALRHQLVERADGLV